MVLILNLGRGDNNYRDVRVDLYLSKTTTYVFDVEKGLPKEWSNRFDIVYSKNLLEHFERYWICFRRNEKSL